MLAWAMNSAVILKLRRFVGSIIHLRSAAASVAVLLMAASPSLNDGVRFWPPQKETTIPRFADAKSAGSSLGLVPFRPPQHPVFTLHDTDRIIAGISPPPARTADVDLTRVRSEARIRIVIPSLVEVENKLKWLIELSPDPSLRKQWPILKEDQLDAFTDGVDETKPISLDVVFPTEDISYELRIPISDLTGDKNGFLQGLRGRSYKVKSLGRGAYEILEKGQKPAHLLFNQDYAWITTGDRPVPTNPPLATADLKPLLALNKDLVAEIKNDLEGIPERRASFLAFRALCEGRNRIRKNEAPNAFELRQLQLKFILDQAQSFLVEAEQLQLGWTIHSSTPNKIGRGDISLTALPGTALRNNIDKFATRPSDFANVAPHENPIVTFKSTVPLDAIRIDQLKGYSILLRPILAAQIDAHATIESHQQKDALKHATSLVMDMIEAGTDLALVDAFAECFTSSSSKNVLVCGIRAANGKKADEIVKLIPSIWPECHVKANAHEHADISIHEVTFAKRDLAMFQSVFDGESVFYVGTGRNAVWGAAGADSLAQLKSAIDQSHQSAPEKVDPIVFSYRLHVGRLVSLFDAIRKATPPDATPLKPEQRRFEKDVDKYLKLAKSVLSGCEPLMFGELKRIDGRIEGSAEFNECVLKGIGSILADTVKDLH